MSIFDKVEQSYPVRDLVQQRTGTIRLCCFARFAGTVTNGCKLYSIA